MRPFILFALLVLPLSCARPADSGPASGLTAPVTAKASADDPVDLVYRVPAAGLPSVGDARALVTVVEFTDYECPFCKRAEATVLQLRAAYGSDLRVVVAERPLAMHDHARSLALAALAADAQGSYATMRAALFAGSPSDPDAIAQAAVGLRLDPSRLARDQETSAAAALAVSEKLADTLNVRGTPTFFINGRRITGAQPYDEFKAVVDERLAKARALVASGVRPGDVYASVIASGAGRVPDDDAPGTCAAGCNGRDEEIGDKIETPAIEGAPSRGPTGAPITIVEYADFECSYCVRGEATVRAVEAAHPGEVRVVWKERPLPMHEHARLYALAAMAAGSQGRFWEMHDRLMALRGPADRAALGEIARDLGLDVVRFSRDLEDPASSARLSADGAEADALGVKGTPTFFVNGLRITGAQPAETFEKAIATGK